MIKRILISLILTVSLSLSGIAGGFAYAQSPVNVTGGNGGACVDSNGNPTAAANSPACKDNSTTGTNPIFGPSGIMTVVIKFLSLIVGIAAIFVIIISGFKFVTSGGDASSVAEARNALLYAIVGIVVAVLGQVLVVFVLDKVG